MQEVLTAPLVDEGQIQGQQSGRGEQDEPGSTRKASPEDQPGSVEGNEAACSDQADDPLPSLSDNHAVEAKGFSLACGTYSAGSRYPAGRRRLNRAHQDHP